MTGGKWVGSGNRSVLLSRRYNGPHAAKSWWRNGSVGGVGKGPRNGFTK